MANVPAGAIATIYRAKHEFEYRSGEIICKDAVWTPAGERNDTYIKKHLCYEEAINLDDYFAERTADDGPAKIKQGSRRKTT